MPPKATRADFAVTHPRSTPRRPAWHTVATRLHFEGRVASRTLGVSGGRIGLRSETFRPATSIIRDFVRR